LVIGERWGGIDFRKSSGLSNASRTTQTPRAPGAPRRSPGRSGPKPAATSRLVAPGPRGGQLGAPVHSRWMLKQLMGHNPSSALRFFQEMPFSLVSRASLSSSSGSGSPASTSRTESRLTLTEDIKILVPLSPRSIGAPHRIYNPSYPFKRTSPASSAPPPAPAPNAPATPARASGSASPYSPGPPRGSRTSSARPPGRPSPPP
jgi:hypothetical protein